MLGGFLGWAGILFAQNYSFTYVSRARNSGSLLRHLKAAVFSNGIWIYSNMLMLGPMFDYLTGKHGKGQQLVAGIVYTVSTVSGSMIAHFISKKTEKGKNAVGASDRYVQITPAELAKMKQDIISATNQAREAYDLTSAAIPDSGISARKFGGEVVTTGLKTT